MGHKRSPIPPDTRQAVLRMRAGGAPFDEISKALGVSKAWISTFLKKRDEEEQSIRAVGRPPVVPPAVVLEPIVVEGLPDPAAEGTASADGASAGAKDIGSLERELQTLYGIAKRTLDPVERTKVASSISLITSRLAALRREEAKARPAGQDDAVKRAGHAAADKLRSLLDEALGERLAAEEAPAP